MNEVNLALICLESEMVESGDPINLRLPVEMIAPVTAEIRKEVEIKSVCPIRVWDLIGPARSLQTIAQILHRRGGVRNRKSLDCTQRHSFEMVARLNTTL
jgi:hypothetical protein